MEKKVYKFYIFVGQLLCFIPWNIEGNNPKYEICNLIQFFTFVISVCGIFLADSYLSLEQCISMFILFIMWIILTSGFITKHKSWKKWNKLFDKTNKSIKVKCFRYSYPSLRIFMALICYVIFWISFQIIIYFTFNEGFNSWHAAFVLIKFYGTYLIIIFTNILRKGFEFLNEVIELSFGEPDEQEHLIIMNEGHPRFYKKIYTNLFEMSVCCNKIFGLLMAMGFLETLTNVLLFMNQFIQLQLKGLPLTKVMIFFSLLCAFMLVSTKIF